MVRCEFKNRHQEEIGQRDWTTCSKYANYSRLHSQLDWEDLYDHQMSRRIFSFIMSKIFIRSPEIVRHMAMETIWIC